MEYCWGGWVVAYALNAEGRNQFVKHMWSFIEYFGEYDLNNINALLDSFKPILKQFPE